MVIQINLCEENTPRIRLKSVDSGFVKMQLIKNQRLRFLKKTS
jgi:hypothetical protein